MAKNVVTVYEIATGKAMEIYPATLGEFLATGDYTTERPATAKPAETALKRKAPTAGREAERMQASALVEEELVAAPVEVAPELLEKSAEAAVEVKSAAKRAPRRRASASEEAAE